MRNMTLNKIAEAVSGRLCLPEGYVLDARCASSVVIDSRKVEEGSVFVATKGERVDGHSFIGQVFEKGALGVICEKLPVSSDGHKDVPGPCILVEDSFVALKQLATYYRDQMSEVRIVGIVGSVGKTSTKEIVASVLEQKYSVLKTEGNFNNEIGVPLTLFRLRDEHEVAVVEMGISDFGEMDRLGAIVRPDAVVMTNIGPCHLEQLGDLDGVLRAKSEVFGHLRYPAMVVLNSEDERLSAVDAATIMKIAEAHRAGVDIASDVPIATNAAELSVLYYGNGGDYYAENIVNKGLEGSSFTVKSGDSAGFETEIVLPGRHQIMNALAASAIGISFGLSKEQVAAGISAARPVSGRTNLIRTRDYLVVDDCYNANPKSMKAAVDLLRDASGRRCAVLGDMFELGDGADALHAEVGEYAAFHGIDVLICVGELSANMYRAAQKTVSAAQNSVSTAQKTVSTAQNSVSAAQKTVSNDVNRAAKDASCTGVEILYFDTRDALLEALPDLRANVFTAGDTILVKASHGMGFAAVVEALNKGSN